MVQRGQRAVRTSGGSATDGSAATRHRAARRRALSVQFVAGGETHGQLEELRALMRHQIPDGDVGKILARAIGVLPSQVRKRKFGETTMPKAAGTPPSPGEVPSRHIPASIRRAVWQRDGGRCTYTSAGGRRCESRDFVEFDHVEEAHFRAGSRNDEIDRHWEGRVVIRKDRKAPL